MLFNSIEFLIFLPIVFLFHWLVFSKDKTTQNIFLLISSYAFYSFWDWRFSFLLLFSTMLDYYSGRVIDKSETTQRRTFWMRLSIVTNIGILCYFKYFNFFIESFTEFLDKFGIHSDPYILNVILPIGISFYTFHGVSYVLDIYYRRIKSQDDIIDYSLFVSYFPLLVAGPIERATHLLPQLKGKREFKYAQGVEGCRLILWGMFKKIVIADSIAPIVGEIFSNYQNLTGITLVLGVLGFAFQVYGDFSGYTDIARGVSKLFGIELILNFNFPYFSRSIPEFWSRWHISLSSWLNDYVFTPIALKYRDYGRHGIFLAVFSTFLISGLWHGAAWHFIIWGALHGLFYIPSIYSQKGLKSMVRRKGDGGLTIKDTPRIILTFTLVCFGYLFFRSSSVDHAIGYIQRIFDGLLHHSGQSISFNDGRTLFVSISMLLLGDWYFKKDANTLAVPQNTYFRRLTYIILLYWVFAKMQQETNFIYFQF
jgi:alginate O-acetyltransferase complex protein AlgI